MTQIIDQSNPDSLKLSNPIPLNRHPAGVYLAGVGEGSKRTIRHALNAIASLLTEGECDAMTLDWSKLRYHHTAAVRVALMQNFAPVTANKMLSTLRRVLLEAFRLDLMSASDYQKAVDFPNIEANPDLRGRCLSETEIAALMATCNTTEVMDVRDAAIIAILRGSGIRRAELVDINLDDFNAIKGEIIIQKGKRGKTRKVFLPVEAICFVEKWLSVRGDAPGPLLCRILKGGHLQLGKMHTDAIWRILKKRAEMAGLESFSPHDFRRTFCSDLLDAGVDIVTVSKLAGHASPVTTAKYDRRGDETLQKAVQKLKI